MLRPLGGRGLGRAAWTLERVFGGDNAAAFRVFGSRFLRVPLGDGYWMPVLIRRKDYEPEVHFILSRVMDPTCAFLDCGANIGWWSVFASTIVSSPRRIVAIEASRPLFERLTGTAALNGDAFTCLNRAIWNVTGERLLVLSDERNHARSSVTTVSSVRQQVRPDQADVVSITLDDVGKEFLHPTISGVVVKLDVEGAEIRALAGGRDLLSHNCLVMYEDHGADPSCHVTGEVIRAGFRVFYCDDAFRVHEVLSPETLQRFKLDPKRGYNLAACRPTTGFHQLMLKLVN